MVDGLTRRLVRADHPIPFNLPLFYFEITVIETAFAKWYVKEHGAHVSLFFSSLLGIGNLL